MRVPTNGKHLLVGFISAFAVSSAVFLYLGLSLKKTLLGYFYFLVTPFLAIPHYPLSLVVMVIILLLLRRVGSCMRLKWRWIAYMLLFLHWAAWGFYCSGYVVF
jgi:hypothetical protein